MNGWAAFLFGWSAGWYSAFCFLGLMKLAFRFRTWMLAKSVDA